MSKKENNKILRPSPWKIIGVFFGIFVAMELIFILSFFSSLEETFIWFTPILAALTIIFAIFSIKETSYEIEGTKIIHKKMGKTNEFYFNDIVYINEEFSQKHKMVLFYTKDGLDHYLMFDKNQVIFDTLLEKVHQISREEMQRRFPNVKL